MSAPRLVIVLATALPMATALAQTPRQAWDRFEGQNGPSRVDWHAPTGTPKAIFGRGFRATDRAVADVVDAQAIARAFIARHTDLLGVGASDFPLRNSDRVGPLYVLVFDQRFRGLDVIGGRLDVRLRASGIVSMFGSRAAPVPADFDAVPQVEPAVAAATAARDRGLPATAGAPPRLVIWLDQSSDRRATPHLAWEVDIDRPDAREVGRSYIDARQGVVLAYRNEWHECGFGTGCADDHVHADADLAPSSDNSAPNHPTLNHPTPSHPTPSHPTLSHPTLSHPTVGPRVHVTNGPVVPGLAALTGRVQAWTNVGLRATEPLTNVPVRRLTISAGGVGSTFTDDQGNFSIPYSGTTPIELTIRFRGQRCGGVTALQGTTYVGGVLASPGQPVDVQIYTASASQFDRSQSTVYWATDNVNEYIRTFLPSLRSVIDRITAQPNRGLTCNATYSRNNMFFYAAGGGCNNTGFSTVVYHEWGHGLDDTYGSISQTDGLSEGWGDIVATYTSGQPIVGEGFGVSGSFIRTARNTRTYPAGGGVHQQGETWMGFAWDLRQDLIGRLGAAAGAAVAEQIVLGSVVADAVNQPDAVREVFLIDDDDGDLTNGTPHYDALAAAAQKRNLPYPVRASTIPGSYVSFGTGCPGTGRETSECQAINDSGTPQGLGTRSGVSYALRATAGQALLVRGFELQTSQSGGATINVQLYAESGGEPGALLSSGTMPVGPTRAWYQARLDQAVTIGAGERFYIGFSNPSTPIEASTINGGTAVPYFRDDGPGGAWNGPISGVSWGFRVLCDGPAGATPTLAIDGVPEIGVNFALTLAAAGQGSTGVLLFGASDTTFLGAPLPLSLGVLGAVGCDLLVSADIALPITPVGGSARAPIMLPPDDALVGQDFYNQFVLIDPGANPGDLVTSNGGWARIGKF
ncbi:MAG: hypothetical protein AAF628_03985 [Planctomycetota bacterium]